MQPILIFIDISKVVNDQPSVLFIIAAVIVWLAKTRIGQSALSSLRDFFFNQDKLKNSYRESSEKFERDLNRCEGRVEQLEKESARKDEELRKCRLEMMKLMENQYSVYKVVSKENTDG